jgi:two-component system, cell cycle response regulator DivK
MLSELVLIIEDNEKNRKLVRDVLQVKGYKTIESETAEEGIKLAIEKSPSLILMDIQLPGMESQRSNISKTSNEKHLLKLDLPVPDEL